MKHKTKIKDNNKLLNCCISLMVIVFIICLYFSQSSLFYEKATAIKAVHIIIYIIIGVASIMFIKRVINDNYKLEEIFLIFVLSFGTIFTLLIPQGIVPDEWTHMYFSNSLASQLTGKEKNGKVTMRTVDVELYNTQVTTPNNEYYTYIYENLIEFTNSDEYINIDIDSVSMTNLFAYFPSVLGTIIARFFGFGAVMTVYFGRLCNFCFYILVTYNAIKKISFGKLLLLAITMLPMVCHQMFSLSYDTVVNATTFLCIAYGLFFVYQSSKVTPTDIFVYSICGVLVIANKGSAYAFILVIPILAKYFNPNGDKIAKKTKIIIFLVVIITILLLNYRSFTDLNQPTSLEAASDGLVSWSGTPSHSIESMLNDIPGAINLFLNTFNQSGWWYITTAIGSHLGWLNILMPGWIINSWLVILIFSSLSEKSNKEVFTYEHKLLYFLISIAVILVVMLAMALAWTPREYDVILGVQGRYFIPIIFLLFICLQNSKIYLKENMVKILLVIIPMMSVISIYNLIPLVL